MDTRNFNIFDKFIAGLRLKQIIDYVEGGDVILDFGCGNKSFLLDSVSYKIKSGVGLDYEVKNKKKNNIEYINYKFKELNFSMNFKVLLFRCGWTVSAKRSSGTHFQAE